MNKSVLLIPGLGASILINRKHPYNYYFGKKVLNNRWVNLYPLSKKYMDRWKDDMRMEFEEDPVTRRILGYTALNEDIVPYDVGGIHGIQNLVHEFDKLTDPYRNIMEETFHYQYMFKLNNRLMELGYIPKETVIGMPYDFRTILDPVVRGAYFKSLKEVIIETYLKQGGRKLMVVSHSLGGIIFKWFLTEYVDEAFIEKYIDTLVIVNSPFGGTPNAVKACTIGDFYVPFMYPLFKDIVHRVSGIIMSLPNPLCYKESDTFVHMEDTNETIGMSDFYKNEGISFRVWKDLYRPYLDTICKPIQVRTKIVLSTENQTAKRFYTKNIESAPYKIDYDMNGDGLIPEKSLQYAGRVFDNHEMLCIPRSDHVGILSHPLFLQKIEEWLDE